MNDLSFRPLGQGGAIVPVRAPVPVVEPAVAPPVQTSDGQLWSDERPPPKPLIVMAPKDEPTGPPPTFTTNILEAEGQNRLHPAQNGQSAQARRTARIEAATDGYRSTATRSSYGSPRTARAPSSDQPADSPATGPAEAPESPGSPAPKFSAFDLKL